MRIPTTTEATTSTITVSDGQQSFNSEKDANMSAEMFREFMIPLKSLLGDDANLLDLVKISATIVSFNFK